MLESAVGDFLFTFRKPMQTATGNMSENPLNSLGVVGKGTKGKETGIDLGRAYEVLIGAYIRAFVKSRAGMGTISETTNDTKSKSQRQNRYIGRNPNE